nr:hypothetical protein [Tanacetum cinerariifolium]
SSHVYKLKKALYGLKQAPTICLWYIDLGCFKHMTMNLKLLINFVWKFLGTVRFGNDHVVAILDLDKVAFRRNTCFIKNLKGVDLLKGDHTTNPYTINLHEMASASPIYLMARATSTLSWDLCNPKNDHEDIRKLGAEGDIGIFISYFANSCAHRIYNRSSGLDLTYALSIITTQRELDLLFEAMYDDYIGGQLSSAPRTTLAAQAPSNRQTPTVSTTTADIAPTPTNSTSQATNIPNT